MDCEQKCVFGREYFETTPPIKITEGRQIGLHQTGWGILSDYYLESVKINCQKSGIFLSSATLNVGDRTGQTTCVVKGPFVGLLFDLSLKEWSNIEKLCGEPLESYPKCKAIGPSLQERAQSVGHDPRLRGSLKSVVGVDI
ncbi:hypothetical protein RR48_09052 [Papilio machaon]|uniref:Uncharacterized protein n=1 Tax=Papilio machaon TaxID=76193 RepID=A0A194RCM1_PAPMA|nr:hypothetical protein RR48_09052 [Papilio machaon]